MECFLSERMESVLKELGNEPDLAPLVDFSLSIPSPFHGGGQIKLIVLGQDPTVHNAQSRSRISTVLDLNCKGNLYKYLSQLCEGLGVKLDNVYATNLFKNFFQIPPTKMQDTVCMQFLPFWLPVLKEELGRFPDVPVITLGQPVLKSLAFGTECLVRSYWGYIKGWREGVYGEFSFVPANHNALNRPIFPFPHQGNGTRTAFYRDNFEFYLKFMKGHIEEG